MPIGMARTDHVDSNKLLKFLTKYKRGDFTARMPVPPDRTGIAATVCEILNEIIEQNQKLTTEIQRVSTVVGKKGNVRQRASLPGVSGSWAQSIDALNTLITDLVQPTTEMARVIGGVA